MRFWRILLEPQGGEGNGTDTGTKVEAKVEAPAADPAEGFKAALKKHGDDAASLARAAWGDAERLRSELAEAKGKLPKADAVVLEGDHAKAWGELSKLGKADEIATALESGKAAVARVSAFERKELIGDAASAHGLNPKVLATLAGADLRIEVKDGTRLGKPVRIAEVVTVEKDAKGADVEKRTPLDKYAEAAWPEFLPSLKGGKAPGPTGSPPAAGGAPRPAIEPQAFRRSLVR